MKVRAARQIRRVYLDDRADHDELPIGPQGGDAVEQLHIHALVYDSKETETRARDGGLVRRLLIDEPRLREVRRVNAAGKRMDVVVLVALGFVEALPAGEDHIGALEQLGLALDHLPWRAAKS